MIPFLPLFVNPTNRQIIFCIVHRICGIGHTGTVLMQQLAVNRVVSAERQRKMQYAAAAVTFSELENLPWK
ncbi:MAG: hypothetical protein ACI4XB_03900 [Ruminococcus sp.]